MLIVEGPDGAGKTTLCQQLMADFRLPIMDWEQEMGVSRDELKQNPTVRYYRALQLEFGGDPLPIIHDRLYFSSLVYGPIMEGNTQMSIEDQRTIARVILALACPIIVCLPPKRVVLDNVRGEGHQMEGVGEVIEDIYDLYPHVMSAEQWPFTMYYDYTGTRTENNFWDYDQLKVRIQHYLNRRAQRRIV